MDIYQAMADPTRRIIIERLNNYEAAKYGLSLKDITNGLTISRQAVTKHLNILIKCGAVKAEFSGREKRHFLQQDAFMDAVSWLQPIAEQWDDRLLALQRHLRNRSKQ